MPYLSITDADRAKMLDAIGVSSVEELFAAIPPEIRDDTLSIPAGISELEAREMLGRMAARNVGAGDLRIFRGAGAYHHFVPSAVSHVGSRTEFVTAYTPYQPEISQGTLRVIYEFQSMVCALTGMDVTNASMYDGATAAAEAVLMAATHTRRKKALIPATVNPLFTEVIKTYGWGYDLEVVEVPMKGYCIDREALETLLDDTVACLVIQHPNFYGSLEEAFELTELVHSRKALSVAIVNPVSLGLLAPPGDWGADIVAAEGQPLGLGLSFGGPYLGILAARKEMMRKMPGRIAGKTLDREGRTGYCLTLQAREQHIRRDKATSNICSNQALCALHATVYMALMGPAGLKDVASLCHGRATRLAELVSRVPGYSVETSTPFFNEFVVRCPSDAKANAGPHDFSGKGTFVDRINDCLADRGFMGGLNLARISRDLEDRMLLCATEMLTEEDLVEFCSILGEVI